MSPIFSQVWATSLSLLLLAGCDPESVDTHPEAAHQAHEEAHGHGGPATISVTLWGEKTQLFVEFPALVVGEDSPFAAHLTRLGDHSALDFGEVVVELSGGGQPAERFSVGGPVRPGLFRPVVRPKYPGKRTLSLRLDAGSASELHPLGAVEVYPTRAAANDAVGHGHGPHGAISYLLEQQWAASFHVARAKARQLRPNLPAFARLTLPHHAEVVVRAPRDGRLMAVQDHFPKVGATVDSGAALFAISTVLQEGADAASLDLAVERAGIRAKAAQREVVRLAPLVAQGVVAQRRLDVARSAKSAAQAEQRGARRRQRSLGQLQRVDGAGDSLDLPSPIGGSIAKVHVVPNAWVTEGQPLARVVNSDQLWLDVGVPEAYVGRLRELSGAWFSLDGVDEVQTVEAAALVSIGVEIDPATRTLPVRFRVDNSQHRLFAGMTTLAHLVIDMPSLAVTVPFEAVMRDGGQSVVFVQVGGETFVRRVVRLGVREGAFIEVKDGVDSGEWVVTDGAYSIKLASRSTESVGHGHSH